ncbi:hypothetical protein [Microbacterium sp. 4NA327F11]|uniref:hypothetical protein n=1 Tax=Microbacterium sp. 4NA327F11 TaxID=2502229 RepID=UPI0010F91C98|nr:hypothetical protein [Microbacterium sp. 4NA327F11]
MLEERFGGVDHLVGGCPNALACGALSAVFDEEFREEGLEEFAADVVGCSAVDVFGSLEQVDVSAHLLSGLSDAL